jgi:hypothetical protein
MYGRSLKQLLVDALMARGILTRKEVKRIARDNGYEESNAERRLRYDKGSQVPCIKLNSKKKPAKQNEYVMFFKWAGGKTKFKV